MSYRVVVAEDQKLARMMIEQSIQETEAFQVAASFDRAADAVEYFRTKTAELVIMDVVMPGRMDGLEAAAQIKNLCPAVKILIVTSMPEVSFLGRARAAGVDSFWYKEPEGVSFREVMERTAAGESIYPDAPPEVILGYASGSSFTERELDVLRGLVSGMSNKEIGASLGIGEGTVKMHVVNMLQKTGFRSRLELAVRARGEGFIIV